MRPESDRRGLPSPHNNAQHLFPTYLFLDLSDVLPPPRGSLRAFAAIQLHIPCPSSPTTLRHVYADLRRPASPLSRRTHGTCTLHDIISQSRAIPSTVPAFPQRRPPLQSLPRRSILLLCRMIPAAQPSALRPEYPGPATAATAHICADIAETTTVWPAAVHAAITVPRCFSSEAACVKCDDFCGIFQRCFFRSAKGPSRSTAIA